jgi:hypothetical protein
VAKTPLQMRHEAALQLVAAGELDPALALSLVVWPPRGSRLEDEQVPLGRQFYSETVKGEALALYDSGLGAVAISRRLGVPYGTVKSWVQPGNRRALEEPISEPAREAQLSLL